MESKIIAAIYKAAFAESVFMLTALWWMFSSTTCMCYLLLQTCSWHTFHVSIFSSSKTNIGALKIDEYKVIRAVARIFLNACKSETWLGFVNEFLALKYFVISPPPKAWKCKVQSLAAFGVPRRQRAPGSSQPSMAEKNRNIFQENPPKASFVHLTPGTPTLLNFSVFIAERKISFSFSLFKNKM